MAITTVILGATMAAMNDAIKATESASQITDMNNGLRTAMDLMVRDLLQVGQGLPGGRAILVPNGANSVPMQLPGPEGSNFQLDGPSFCPPRATDPDTICEEITAVIPGPGRGPVSSSKIGPDRHDHDARRRQLVRSGHPEGVCGRRPEHHGAEARCDRVTRCCPVSALRQTRRRHPSGHIISDDPDVGGDNIRPGDLIMLTKGAASTLVQVSSVTAAGVFPQVITFAANDSLNLNQTPPVRRRNRAASCAAPRREIAREGADGGGAVRGTAGAM